MEKQQLNEMIGERLKRIRTTKGLSLEMVSELTGVSKPMLAQIERAMSNPTVSTLWKIAEGLNVPFSAFIEEQEGDVKHVQKEDITPIKEANNHFEVYSIFQLTNNRPFEIYEVNLLPGCNYPADPHPPGVEEYLWVTKGRILLEYNNEKYAIGAAQGLRFTADRPHRYINESDEEAVLMMVIYYPQKF
ncbi:MAG: helix-turn-helix domain-containing protein [Tuberibacillus sp.]